MSKKKIMAEEIPMEDFSRDNDDDDNYDWDDDNYPNHKHIYIP